MHRRLTVPGHDAGKCSGERLGNGGRNGNKKPFTNGPWLIAGPVRVILAGPHSAARQGGFSLLPSVQEKRGHSATGLGKGLGSLENSIMQPTIRRAALRALCAAGLALSVAACATTGSSVAPDYATYMAEAEAALEAGQAEEALHAYWRAASSEPGRKEPWQQITQLHSEAGRSVQALAAAEEVLHRDPADAEAGHLFITNALQATGRALNRVGAGDDSLHATFLPEARALVAQMIAVFGDDTVPEEVRTKLGKQAVDRYKASHPQREVPKKPPSDPLDVLGGH